MRRRACVWRKTGKRAKFCCPARNCEQTAEHSVNSVGPLRGQVDNNSKRIEELEKRRLAQESEGTGDAEREMTKAVSEVTRAVGKK